MIKRFREISLFVKEKNILWFIAITYVATWILWIAAFKVNGFFRIIGSFVPSVMGIVFICKKDKEEGWKLFINSVKRYKVKWYVYFFIMFYTILSFFAPYLLTKVFLNLESFQIRRSIGIFDVSNPLIALVCFATILLFGGPLGEEFGWRGFLLPQLEERFLPITSGILVGIVWACWHLPMFLFHVEGYQMSFLLYLVQTIFMSIICTWLYHTSGNSLLMILLFHTMDNFVCSIAYQALLEGKNLYTFLYWAIQLILIACIIRDLRKYTVQNQSKLRE
jgi:CAAX amino terminal protease family.